MDMVRFAPLFWLAGGLLWAQCFNYNSNNCPGAASLNLAFDPPSPQCSYSLPLTVQLFPVGVPAGATVTFYFRANSTGGWNSTANPATVNQTGNHQFMMIVQQGGCRDTVIRCYTVTQKPTASITAINPASPRCDNALPLTLNVSATYGSTITSYNWYVDGTLVSSGPNNNQTLTNAITTVGTHTIKLVVIDTAGCRDSVQQSYVVSATPTASFTATATNACRGRRICFTNTSTGTGPGTTYSWNFGDGGTSSQPNPCHRYNNPGTYTVTLTVCNPGGCCNTATQAVTIQPGGLADILGNGLQDTIKYCVIPGDPTTTFTVTFTNGGDCPGGGCIYTWNFGYDGVTLTTLSDTPQVHTYTSFGEGWAYLTVQHPGGCVHKDSIYVVFQPQYVAVTFDIPPLAGGCAPYTITIQNISNTNATTFIWDYGDGTRDTVSPPSTAPFTHTYTSPGTYQIRVDAYNACGSSYAIRGPILVAGKPRITSVNVNPNPGCAPQNVSFSATAVNPPPNASAPITYYWNFGDGSPEATGQNQTHFYPTKGIYTVTVRACNLCGCDTARVTLTIDSLPKANIQASPLEGCHPLTVNFTNLSQPNMAAGIMAPFWEGLYIDGGRCCGPWWSSCACRCPDYIDSHDFFSFNGYCWSTYGCCQGSSTALPGRPMNIPPLTFTNPTGNAIRTYNLLYIIGNHCGRDSQQIQIKVHPPVVARFTPSASNVCVGTPITFTNNSYGDSLTFIWDMGDGSPYIYDTAMAAAVQMPRSHTYTYTTPGTYTVTLYVQGYCGRDTLRRTINVYPYPTPTFTVDASQKCRQGGSASFTFTNTSVGNPPGTTYSWSFPGGTPSSSTASPVTVTYTAAGTYQVILTANYNGCIRRDTQYVTVHPTPTVNFSVTPASGCPPLSVSITPTIPNTPGYTYIWDYGNGNPRDTSYTPASPVVYDNLTTANQTYTITLYVISDKGCIDSLKRTITVRGRVFAGFTVSPSLLCQGGTVTFTNTSSGANSYTWDFGDGTPTSTAANPTHTYTAPGTYQVILAAVNTTTGCRDTARQTITVQPIPLPTFTASPTGGCMPLTVTLTNTTPLDPTYLYIWNYGNGAPPETTYTPSAPTYTTGGTYTVSLEVVTPAGCRRTSTQTITVSPKPVASFSALPTACQGAAVSFSNTSTGATSYQWDFGDGSPVSTVASPTHVFSAAGTYTVQLIAQSGAGCRDTTTRTIQIYPKPTADFSFTVECLGSPTTFTDLSVGAVAWQWTFGDGSPIATAQNPTHTYAAAGTYTVQLIVTSADGCKDTITKSVPVNTTPNPNFSASTACLGQATVFTDLTPGTPTSWQWDFGDGSPISTVQNPTHTYTAPGTYTVKLVVSLGSGCTDSITKPVTVHPVPTAGFTATSACAVDEAVTFTNTSSGATSYQWDFGDGSPISTAANPTHTYATGGTYTVQLIAINAPGCRDTFTQTVVVYPKPAISIVADTVCLGGTTTLSGNTTVPLISWQWDFGDTQTGAGQTVTHTYTAPGLYTVQLIGQTADGCRDTAVRQVWVKPLPTAAFTASTPCFGETMTFTDQSTGAVAWNWDFGDGVGTSTLQNPSYIYAAPGTYTVTLTVWNTVGCSHTITQAVTVRPKPTAAFIADTVCWTYPTTFTDQSVGAVSWLWDFGDSFSSTLQNPQHTYANPGTYTVTLIVTNAQGCKDTVQKSVLVYPRPIAGFSYDTACALRPMQFTDTTQGVATFWLWDFGDGNSSTLQNPVHVYAAGGVYTVTLTVGNGVGCTDQVSVPVAVYTMPAVDFVADTVCIGQVTHFTNLTQDSVPVSYVWLFGDGNASFSVNPTYIYQAPGTYQVTLVATNIHGCDTFITKPVVVAPVPQANFIADTACAGGVTTFTDATQGLVDTWIWNFGDGTVDTVRVPSVQHLYPGPGVYVVSMTALFGTCASTITKGVRVVDSVDAQILLSEAVICPGEAITALDASTGGPQWWVWDMGNGQTFTTQNVPNVVYPDSGLYTIRLIVGNGYCTDTATASLYVIGQPQALFSVQNACAGTPLPIQNVSFPSALPVEWIWDFGNGDTSHAMNPTYVYPQPGTYTVTLILGNGRCGDTLRQTVTIWPNPTAVISVRDSITRIWKETYFSDLTAGTIIQREWNLGDGSTTTQRDFVYMYRDTGSYLVRLVVMDDKGCVDTAYQRVIVYGDFTMYVPTAFSPNGDGVNDVFYPGGVWFDVYDFLFQIYNRWGQLIWETRERGHAWDGRDMRTGEVVPEDAYVFRIRGMDFKGKYHEYVGTVTVLK